MKLTEEEQKIIEEIRKEPENERYFPYLPEEKKTEAVCLAAVEVHPYHIRYVPYGCMSDQVVHTALEKNGEVIGYLPAEYYTQKMCEIAIKSNPMAIIFIPDHFKTDDMLRDVIYSEHITPDDWMLLRDISNPDICLEALKYFLENSYWENTFGKIFSQISKDVIHYPMAQYAVQKDPDALKYIPDHLIDYDLCKDAVSRYGVALQYVPSKWRDKELCKIAIQTNLPGLAYCPPSVCDEDFYLRAVKYNADSIRHVPEKERSERIYQAAFEKGLSSGFSEIKDVTFLERYLKNCDEKQFGNFIVSNNRAVINRQIAEIIVERNAYYIDRIPFPVLTPEICLKAVKKVPGGSTFVPEKIYNGNNLYSFNRKVEKELDTELSIEQTKELFRGKTIQHRCKNPKDNIVKDHLISYNEEKELLSIKPLEIKKQKSHKLN